jgi:hypothetical protein
MRRLRCQKKQPQRGVKRCDCRGGRICKTSAGPLSTQTHAAVDCCAIQTAFQIYLGFSTHVASERFHALESRFCDMEPCMRWTPSIVPRGDDHNIGGRHGTASTDTKIDRQRFSRCCAGCENPAYAREKRPQDPNMAGTGLRASHVTNPRSEMPDGERLRG